MINNRMVRMVLFSLLLLVLFFIVYNNEKDKETKISIAQQIREGSTTSTQQINRIISRIDSNEKSIKSFVHVFKENALALANKRDKEANEGNFKGRLHGVPFAVKDMFTINNYNTFAGFSFPIFTKNDNSKNAPAIQQLLDEGAILFATTQLTEGAWTQYNKQCLLDKSCPPNNPFGEILWEGDSSSGCGTGLSAGFFDICIATDTSGSIRNPCLMNSLACIKPSRHVIDRNGVWPFSQSLDTVGVMARHSVDLASVMQAYEPYIDYETIMNESVKGMKIGVDFGLISQVATSFPELKENIDNTIDVYKQLGVQIIPINIPVDIMDKLAEKAKTTISLEAYDNYTNFTASELNNINTHLQNLIQEGGLEAEQSDAIKQDKIDNINDITQQFVKIWQELYEDNNLDAVLLLVWGVPAPLKSEIPTIITDPNLFAAAVRYMVPFNYIDLPLVVVAQKTPSNGCRVGESLCVYSDRPSAFQLIGTVNKKSSAKLLQLAYAYEKERGELIYPFTVTDNNL